MRGGRGGGGFVFYTGFVRAMLVLLDKGRGEMRYGYDDVM